MSYIRKGGGGQILKRLQASQQTFICDNEIVVVNTSIMATINASKR